MARTQTDLERGDWFDTTLGRRTLAEWAQEYLDGAVHKRPTTLARDRSALRVHVLPALGRKPVASITQLDVRRFVEVLSSKVAPGTVRSVFGVLRAVMAAAVDAELIKVSPCRGAKLPANRPTDKRFLTPDELVASPRRFPPSTGRWPT